MKFIVDVTLKPHVTPEAFAEGFLNWLTHNSEANELIALVSFDSVEPVTPTRKQRSDSQSPDR